MNKHHERVFEDEIVADMQAQGWLVGAAEGYGRELALYPEDVLGWLQQTQPQELARLRARYGDETDQVVLRRVAEELDHNGALHVLRHGFKDVGVRLALCQFRPAQQLNATTLERYQQVRCRVVRQVRYSLHNQNSIDLVLFVNGIPVATAELKTDFTQSVHDAVAQYRRDRLPRDAASRRDEPLLMFKRRALVHFAVSSDEVQMTTSLQGAQTEFLPFNQGNDGGAGNPPNPQGYRTAYLWQRVWQRDSWLDILSNFAHLQTTGGQRQRQSGGERLIFPRYHQYEAVNALVAAARTEGPGQRYLIQHSAGSGKSNSIAWLAHRLASLHDATDRKIFDSVIVVTDRTLLDAQLQDTIYQFEHKTGVVVSIKDEQGVKSQQLARALSERAPIIVVTLQTFSYVQQALREQGTLHGRRFAVIADEAHSSQSGSAANALSKALADQPDAEEAELSLEDLLLADMEQRAEHPNISYFAFTATPKYKTLLRFGQPPDPSRVVSNSNMPQPFHSYTMQQAIEEGFILDVLQNYTPYRLAFKLAHNGQDYDQAEIDRSAALSSLMQWVRLHPYNISQKVAIIVEHFRATVQPLLDGRAKAMVVTGSRREAVRYKLAVDRYIREQGYTDLAALVAFSGEVHDADSGPLPFSETSMNPALRGRDIRTAFDTDAFQLLVVANKYQTGFDQPLLCAMYVDKRLDGINAVQTLSRLNRITTGKTTTYVLDFVNQPEDMLAAFRPYYRTAALADVADPNMIHRLQLKLDAAQIYSEAEIAAFVRVWHDRQGSQRELHAQITPAVERFRVRWRDAIQAQDRQRREELELFRKDLGSFVRLYDFLSQIINYADTELEQRAIFFRQLLPLLQTERLAEPIDLSTVSLTHYKLKDQGSRRLALREDGGSYGLTPPTAIGSGSTYDPIKSRLSEIIQKLNDLFEGELAESDMLAFTSHVRDRLLSNAELRTQARQNSKEQFALGDFRSEMMDAVAGGLDSYQTMASQVLGDRRVREGFAAVVLDMLYPALRAAPTDEAA